jgi:hypothetical protein
MRFLFFVFSLVTLFALAIGPGAARQGDEAAKKRQAENQKEIGELQARIRKLAAESAVSGVGGPDPVGMEGSILLMVADDKAPAAFYVLPRANHVAVRQDTKIFYSDNRKANLSDLRAGQLVAIGGKVVENSQPPKVEADVIFIETSAREIIDAKDAGAIAKQVDFATEYLLLCRWTGWSGYAHDRLSFTVEQDKDGPVVVFRFCRPVRQAGMAKVTLQSEERLYVIAKNARVAPVVPKSPEVAPGKAVAVTVTGFPPAEVTNVTKITNAEEFAKAFPTMK